MGVEIGSEHLHWCYRFIQFLPQAIHGTMAILPESANSSVSVDCCPNRKCRNVRMDKLQTTGKANALALALFARAPHEAREFPACMDQGVHQSSR